MIKLYIEEKEVWACGDCPNMYIIPESGENKIKCSKLLCEVEAAFFHPSCPLPNKELNNDK